MLGILRAIGHSLRLIKVLLSDYGYFSSVRSGRLTDSNGYIPWFTYPAIEALKTWNLSDKTVLEYGSGYSTLFWAKRAKSVVSIEHNPDWYHKVSNMIPENVDLRLRPLETYPEIRGQFDIIVIDGYAQARMRYRCTTASLQYLNPNGMVIVDNSDWLPATCWFLRQAGLIQMDFSGFVPGNPHTQTTSIFLTREFNFDHSQRVSPVGGTGYNWELALEQELLNEMAHAQSGAGKEVPFSGSPRGGI